MLRHVSTISPEVDPMFGFKNILLIAAGASVEVSLLAGALHGFFDEIVTVTKMSEACRVLKTKRVTHLVISEKFCTDAESAKLISDWQRMHSGIGRAVLSAFDESWTYEINLDGDVFVGRGRSPATILHALFCDHL